jgi:hypothetical protein
METRDNPQNNTGYFSTIPDDVIKGPLARSLTINNLKKLQQTCRFFTNCPELDKALEEKLKNYTIAANLFNTFILQKNGIAYVIGKAGFDDHEEFTAPHLLTLPNGRPIVDIITAKTFAILKDDLGNVFGFGDNRGDAPGVNLSVKFLKKPAAIVFPVTPQPKIIKIAASESHVIFISDKGECFTSGNSICGQAGHSPAVRTINTTPCLITWPNKKPIVDVNVSSRLTFLRDNEGQWYQCGSKEMNYLFARSNLPYYQPSPISFLDGSPIIEIVNNNNSLYLRDKTGQWFLGQVQGMDKLPLMPLKLSVEFKKNTIIKIIPSPSGHKTSDSLFCQDNTGAWFHCFTIPQTTPRGYINPQIYYPITLESNKKIVHIIAASFAHTLYVDEKGNYYGKGANNYGGLVIDKNEKKIEKITLIDFHDMIANQQQSNLLNLPKPK